MQAFINDYRKVWALSLALLSVHALMSLCFTVRVEAKPSWAKVVKAAEEEGQVTIYAGPIGDLPIIREAFQKKFPKVKISITTPGVNICVAVTPFIPVAR